MHSLMSAAVFGLVPVPLASSTSARKGDPDQRGDDQACSDRNAAERPVTTDEFTRIRDELMQQPCDSIDDVGPIRGLAHHGSVGPPLGCLGGIEAGVEHERDAQVR